MQLGRRDVRDGVFKTASLVGETEARSADKLKMGRDFASDASLMLLWPR